MVKGFMVKGGGVRNWWASKARLRRTRARDASPRIRRQPGGFYAGDGADLVIVADIVIVEGVAGGADGAKEIAAVLGQHAAGHRHRGACASAFTALTK
jgi:hypothetical protein